jgi:hypothetical protein
MAALRGQDMHNRQQGMTLIGFLMLAALFGLLAYGVLRLVPVYGEYLTVRSVLNSVKTELDGQGADPRSIRTAIERKLTVESVNISARDFKITQTANGHVVTIDHEGRAPYIANVQLVVTFEDLRVEIRR